MLRIIDFGISSLEATRDRLQEHDCKPRQKRPLAVVHVGPRNTGSNGIQHLVLQFMDQMKEHDKYVVPVVPGGPNEIDITAYDYYYAKDNTRDLPIDKNTAHLAGCLNPDNLGGWCKSFVANFEKFLYRADCEASNIVFSSEEFSNPYIEISLLKKLLEPSFRVRIVLYHRRFDLWFRSMHNEFVKSTRDLHGDGVVFPTIDKWLATNGVLGTQGMWSPVAVYRRYSKHFSNITVIDVDRLKGTGTTIEESFFCNGIPDAPVTCRTIRAWAGSMGNQKLPANPSQSLYEISVLGALRAQGYNVTKKAETAIRARLRGSHVFDELSKVCPGKDRLQKFLNMTLSFERELADALADPSWNFDAKALKQDFWENVAPKLCSINLTIIEGWKTEDWFREMVKNEPVPPSQIAKFQKYLSRLSNAFEDP